MTSPSITKSPAVKVLGLAVLFLIVSTLSAAAQSFTFSSNTNSVSIPISASDYDLASGSAAVIALTGNTFAIKSTNNTWTLSVRAQTSTFAFVPSLSDSNPNKPCGDLSVRENGVGNWLALTTTSQYFSSGPRQNLTAPAKQLPIDYRFSSNLRSDPPGSYSITVIWTLTQP